MIRIEKRIAKTSLRPYYCINCNKSVREIMLIEINYNGVYKQTWLCLNCFNKLFNDK